VAATHREKAEAIRPRGPLCASARITILISLHPHAFCSNCDAR